MPHESVKSYLLQNLITTVMDKHQIRSQAELCRKVGLHPSYLSQMLRGNRPVLDRWLETFTEMKCMDAKLPKIDVDAPELAIKIDQLYQQQEFFAAYFRILKVIDNPQHAYFALNDIYISYYKIPKYHSYRSFRAAKNRYIKFLKSGK